MLPAWDYAQVCRQLSFAFQYRYPDRKIDGIRMVGLLFAPPQARLARDEIVPGLEYFHQRSGNHIDFFCAGYSRYGHTHGERPVTNDEPPWMFSLQIYNRFRMEVEQLSRWQYSGEADLLLMNGTHDRDSDGASLDFGSAIVCDLDHMVRDGAIQSVRRFFEDVFQFAEKAEAVDPMWGFSDKMGARTAGCALKRVILSLLPKKLGDDYRKAEHFAVRDVSIPS